MYQQAQRHTEKPSILGRFLKRQLQDHNPFNALPPKCTSVTFDMGDVSLVVKPVNGFENDKFYVVAPRGTAGEDILAEVSRRLADENTRFTCGLDNDSSEMEAMYLFIPNGIVSSKSHVPPRPVSKQQVMLILQDIQRERCVPTTHIEPVLEMVTVNSVELIGAIGQVHFTKH